MDQTLPPDEAAAALGLVSSSRSQLADRLVTPGWYHPAFALLGATAVLGYGTGSRVLGALGVVVFTAGAGVLIGAYRRLTGVWVSGHRAGPAKRYAVAGGLVLGIGMLASLGARAQTGGLLPSALLAVAVAVLLVLLGRRYDVVLRADLRAGAGPSTSATPSPSPSP